MRKFLSVFLLLAILITACAPAVVAASSDIFDYLQKEPDYIFTSDVMEDLSRTYFDGKPFNPEQYPLDPQADYMLLLNFFEYSFDLFKEGDDTSLYSLFFYLYNPSGDKPVLLGNNAVQMSVGLKDSYDKYNLSFVSASEDNRFLKFKIESPAAILDQLYGDIRSYKISGIEIETKARGVNEYKIAGTFTFTGFQALKNLECKMDTLTTISLEVGDTYYRTDTSAEGEYHRNQLDSVYFAIPNKLLELYGNEIYEINFEMTQKRITGIVTSDQAAYNAVNKIIGNGISPTSYDDFRSSYSEELGWSFSTGEIEGFFDWDRPYAWNSPATYRRDYLSFFTYVSNYDPNDFTWIDGEELLRYWDKYPLKDESCVDIIPKKNYLLSIKDSFSSVDYQSSHNFFETMLDYGLGAAIFGDKEDSSLFQNVQPFQELDYSDLKLMNNDLVAITYYVSDHDVEEIRSFVKDAEESGMTTFLFRFNTQDFLAIPGGMQKERISGLESVTLDSYYFEEYIYEDFDIMEIALRNEQGVITRLPAIMSPITIVPDIEGPLRDPLGGDDNLKKIIGILLVILFLAVVVYLIIKFIPKKVKVVGSSSGRRRRHR